MNTQWYSFFQCVNMTKRFMINYSTTVFFRNPRSEIQDQKWAISVKGWRKGPSHWPTEPLKNIWFTRNSDKVLHHPPPEKSDRYCRFLLCYYYSFLEDKCAAFYSRSSSSIEEIRAEQQEPLGIFCMHVIQSLVQVVLYYKRRAYVCA